MNDAQFVENCCDIYGTYRFIAVFTTARHWTVPSQTNPFLYLTSRFLNIRFMLFCSLLRILSAVQVLR
jgi:hypothetical protein